MNDYPRTQYAYVMALCARLISGGGEYQLQYPGRLGRRLLSQLISEILTFFGSDNLYNSYEQIATLDELTGLYYSPKFQTEFASLRPEY